MNDHEDMIDVFERRLMKFDGHELGVVEHEVVCTYHDTTREINDHHEDMTDVFERRLMKFDGHELGY